MSCWRSGKRMLREGIQTWLCSQGRATLTSEMPLARAVSVRVAGAKSITVTFEDGITRTVDVSEIMPAPMLARLLERDSFDSVFIDPDTGAVSWPSGIDIDSDVLRYGFPTSSSPRASVRTLLARALRSSRRVHRIEGEWMAVTRPRPYMPAVYPSPETLLDMRFGSLMAGLPVQATTQSTTRHSRELRVFWQAQGEIPFRTSESGPMFLLAKESLARGPWADRIFT